MADLDKVIWEGWTARDFIAELEPTADMIMNGESWIRPFQTKKELVAWCKDNQPYYKKSIAAVNNYFAKKYGLK